MVKVSQVVGTEKSVFAPTIKAYSFTGVLAAVAFLTSFFLNKGELVAGVVFFVVFLTLFIVAAIVLPGRSHLVAGVALSAVAFALPFYSLVGSFFFTAFAALFLLSLAAALRGKWEADESLKVRPFRVARVVTGALLTGAVIFFTAVLILASGFSVKRERVDQFIEIAAAPVFERFYGVALTPQMTTEEVLRSLVEADAAENEEFRELPPALRAQAIEESVSEIEENLEEFLGVEIDAQAPVGESAHQIIQSKLGELSPRARTYWSVVLILFVWLSVKAIEVLVYIPLALLAWLVYELLVAMGFVAVEFQTRNKEVVTLR